MNRDDLLGAPQQTRANPFANLAKLERVSAHPSDPSCKAWDDLCSQGLTVDVFLDGVMQDKVVTADTRQGYIVQALTDEDGRFFMTGDGEVATRMIFGRVMLKIITR